jgi:hypothetical protein
MRHDGGNTLKYQDNREGLRTLPRNPMECDKLSEEWTSIMAAPTLWVSLCEATALTSLCAGGFEDADRMRSTHTWPTR